MIFYVGIDPGRTNTGVAVIDLDRHIVTLVRESGKDEIALCRRLERIIPVTSFVAIEGTWAWGGGAKDYARKRGAMENRALAEFIRGWLTRARPEAPTPEMISPQKWKGNAPKDIIHRRLLNLYPTLPEKLGKGAEDQLDALGIAVWLRKSQPTTSG